MRLLRLSGLLALAGCAQTAPPSDDEHADHIMVAASKATLPSEASTSILTTVFDVQLRAENESNGASTSESKGHAQVKVYEDGSMEFFLMINNKGGETITRAHIHKGAAGVNGPIHWDFLEAGNPVASLTGQPADLRGIGRPRAAAVLADLLAHPENNYVNAHSTAFPGGAMRGQLR